MPTLEEPPIFVDRAEDLRRLARKLAKERVLAVDCEANSFHAYNERLCLLQISTGKRDYIIDPIADGVTLAPLAPVFADPGIIKVFHSAEFDVLLLKRAFPLEIAGLFDTRVAAASLGSEQLGLAPLLEHYYDIQTDKKYQRSDWGARPLSEAQLEYARIDTRYLIGLAGEFRRQLHSADALHLLEVASECRRLESLEPEPRALCDDDLVKVKGGGKLDSKKLRLLAELNRWRHELAAERDVPLFKVVSNDILLALATQAPKTPAEIRRTSGVPTRVFERFGDDLAKVLAKARSMPAFRRQRKPRNGHSSAKDKDVYESLRAWRRDRAEARGTDASLILTRATMEVLSRIDPLPRTVADLEAANILERWRIAEYGAEIVEALARP